MYKAGVVRSAINPEQEHIRLGDMSVVEAERFIGYRNCWSFRGWLIFRRIYRYLARTNGHLLKKNPTLSTTAIISRLWKDFPDRSTALILINRFSNSCNLFTRNRTQRDLIVHRKCVLIPWIIKIQFSKVFFFKNSFKIDWKIQRVMNERIFIIFQMCSSISFRNLTNRKSEIWPFAQTVNELCIFLQKNYFNQSNIP